MTLNLNIYLTWKCNFKCAHCVHSCDASGKHMSLEHLARAFDFIDWANQNPALTLTVLGITGGEPTLHPNFWDTLMPRLNVIKRRWPNNNDNIELFTNGSLPIPMDEFKFEYNRMFSNIYIGRDIFHDQFGKVDELFLNDYEFFTKDIHLRKCAYLNSNKKTYSAVRKKGRASDIKFEPRQPRRNCHIYNNTGHSTLMVNFTPDCIIFCGENAAKDVVIDDKTAIGYDTENTEIIRKSFDYNQLYSGIRCKCPCMEDMVCIDDIKS